MTLKLLRYFLVIESSGGRVTRANYLASPPLVVAYARAGTVDIIDTIERLYWPTSEEIANVVQSSVLLDMFRATYEAITQGNLMWNQLSVPSSTTYSWDPTSTYIHMSHLMTMCPLGPHGVQDACCSLNFGDSITTDHISPAGSIHKDSPAAKYIMWNMVLIEGTSTLMEVSPWYNGEVMARGTSANIRIMNKLLNGEVGPKTIIHIPSGEKLSVYDAAMRGIRTKDDMILLFWLVLSMAVEALGTGLPRDQNCWV